jgi:hypothetical protein
MPLRAHEDTLSSETLSSSSRRGRVSAVRGIANFLWQGTRWGSLRGGWFPGHLRNHRSFDERACLADTPIEIMVCVVDHFEPGERQGDEAAAARVVSWGEDYRRIAEKHRDADGRPPQHTWFYRFEYLNPGCIRALCDEAFQGFGELEFHLHHGHDNHETFAAKLKAGLDLANQFGAMLTAEATPQRRFAYIAGNWSLDNGCRDPSKSGCNTELVALRESGCYADFTFPALGSRAQPRKTNAIYYATDDPRPKSYDTGIDVEVKRPPLGDLMIVQGPSLFDWESGSFESAALENNAPPSAYRLDPWLYANIHVRGRPEWIFIKLHTHSLQSRKTFLGPDLNAMFTAMETRWNRSRFRLHYVTAREMYNIIKAAEAGNSGDPNPFRDFEVPRPANRLIRCDRPWRLETYQHDCVRLSVLDAGPATIEFELGPLRSVHGWIRSLEARFHRNEIVDLKIGGEGSFHVATRNGKSSLVQSVPTGLVNHDG